MNVSIIILSVLLLILSITLGSITYLWYKNEKDYTDKQEENDKKVRDLESEKFIVTQERDTLSDYYSIKRSNSRRVTIYVGYNRSMHYNTDDFQDGILMIDRTQNRKLQIMLFIQNVDKPKDYIYIGSDVYIFIYQNDNKGNKYLKKSEQDNITITTNPESKDKFYFKSINFNKYRELLTKLSDGDDQEKYNAKSEKISDIINNDGDGDGHRVYLDNLYFLCLKNTDTDGDDYVCKVDDENLKVIPITNTIGDIIGDETENFDQAISNLFVMCQIRPYTARNTPPIN